MQRYAPGRAGAYSRQFGKATDEVVEHAGMLGGEGEESQGEYGEKRVSRVTFVIRLSSYSTAAGNLLVETVLESLCTQLYTADSAGDFFARLPHRSEFQKRSIASVSEAIQLKDSGLPRSRCSLAMTGADGCVTKK
jgi:hypothetical protein